MNYKRIGYSLWNLCFLSIIVFTSLVYTQILSENSAAVNTFNFITWVLFIATMIGVIFNDDAAEAKRLEERLNNPRRTYIPQFISNIAVCIVIIVLVTHAYFTYAVFWTIIVVIDISEHEKLMDYEKESKNEINR